MAILIVTLILLLLFGVPIAITLGVFCVLYAALISDAPLAIVPQQLIAGVDSFLLLAVPMFMLAGELMSRSDMTDRLVQFSRSLVGWIRGGIAQVNLMTNVLMAGISGSALADAPPTGAVLIPAMVGSGYSAAFSATVTAFASGLGPIIPPSITMILIGGLTKISIGKMFLGGVLPGLLLALAYGVTIYIVARKRRIVTSGKWSYSTFKVSFLKALPSLGLPLIIAAGFRTGVLTPTEAAGVAVLYTLVVGVLFLNMSLRSVYRALVEVGANTGALMFIVGVSAMVGWILIESQFGDRVVELLQGIVSSGTGVLVLSVGILIALGCVIEIVAVLVLAIPVLAPVMDQFNVDPVHFGVVATIALALGLISPPFGLTLFLTSRMAGVSIGAFTREALPFYFCMLVVLGLLILFPGIVTALPNALMGNQ